MYSDKVMKHFKDPENVGEIPDADGTGISEDSNHGNIVKIWIKVEKTKITAITFKSNGCVPVIAAGSAITQMALKKTVDQALKIKQRNLIKALGGLPESKYHCAELAVKALKEAVKNYTDKHTDTIRA